MADRAEYQRKYRDTDRYRKKNRERMQTLRATPGYTARHLARAENKRRAESIAEKTQRLKDIVDQETKEST